LIPCYTFSTVWDQSTDFRRPRRVKRWTSGVSAGLVVSLVAHAVLGVTIGVVLSRPSHSARQAQDFVDVDVAPPENLAGEKPAEPFGTPTRKPSASSSAHRSKARTTATPSSPLAASSSMDESSEVAPRFVLSAGTIASRGSDLTAGATSAQPGATATGPEVFAEGVVDVPARLLSTSPLVYPPAARQAEIELDLPVEIVIETDGHVSAARALSHAGYGLDEAAVRAVRLYRFSPAIRAGLPVRVRMRWTMQFRLR
jgi:protein TonB